MVSNLNLVSFLIVGLFFLLLLYCYIVVFGNYFDLNMFRLHLTWNLLAWQHIHLLSFHVMDQTYGLLYKDQSCFHQWWGEHLEDQRKQEIREMMSLGTTSNCQDNQNQLFVKKKYGKVGHNKKTCKGKWVDDKNISEGGNKVICFQDWQNLTLIILPIFVVNFNRIWRDNQPLPLML